MTFRHLLSALIAALALAACNGRPAQSPGQQPSESFDADEYNATQSPNDTSAPSGYYGTGSSGPPERTPADPGGHQPAR
jgi:hypothetical protein